MTDCICTWNLNLKKPGCVKYLEFAEDHLLAEAPVITGHKLEYAHTPAPTQRIQYSGCQRQQLFWVVLRKTSKSRSQRASKRYTPLLQLGRFCSWVKQLGSNSNDACVKFMPCRCTTTVGATYPSPTTAVITTKITTHTFLFRKENVEEGMTGRRRLKTKDFVSEFQWNEKDRWIEH